RCDRSITATASAERTSGFRGLPGWRRAWQCALLLRLEPLLFAASHHPDALGREQVLRHRAAQLTDGLAHFAADLLVNLAGAVFGSNVFPPQFVLRLGCAEQVRGQFRAVHVVENVLLLLQPLAPVDVAPPRALVRRRSPQKLARPFLLGSGEDLL